MKITKRELIWGVLGLLGLVCFYLITTLSFWFYSKDRIYPRVSVAGVSLAGKTKSEAEKILGQKTKEFAGQKIDFSGEVPVLVGQDEVGIEYDVKKSVEQAFDFGNRNPFVLGLKKDLPLEVNFDEQATFKTLSKIDQKTKTPVVNSKLEKQGTEITVSPGSPGKRLNYGQTTENMLTALSKRQTKVAVAVVDVTPSFSERDLDRIRMEIADKTSESFLIKNGDEQAFAVSPETLVTWVELPGNTRSMSDFFEGDPFAEAAFSKNSSRSIFSDSLVSGYLVDISKKIDSLPKNAKLGVSEGKVVAITPAIKGKSVKIKESREKIIEALDKKESEAELVVETKNAEVSEENLSELGLASHLSTGYSTFTGSPANRIHNIKTGAGKFNGVLIKPNERFSFNTALGPVDGEHGFLPELVIKENKTVPEFGGGMCQVSSTAFRAALNAGLPILERKAHSYPVVYYKPYGVDATIYLPKPDLVFRNDTGKYIFIQTSIVGSRLTFDFYGTKPVRNISFSGTQDGAGAVEIVEKVNPSIWDQGARGNGSFTAAFYRFIKDSTGKVIKTDNFVSKYDSPDKYPH